MTMAPTPWTDVAGGQPLRSILRSGAGALSPLIGVALVMGFFVILDYVKQTLYGIPVPPVLTRLQFQTILVQMIIFGTAALGMTLIIASGGIDLSVGSAVALCSVVAALILKRTGNDAMSTAFILAAAIGGSVLVGGLCGLYNGLLVTGLRLPAFIATLGTMGFYRGVAKWISDSQPVTAPTYGIESWVRPSPGQDWMLLAPGAWMLLGLALVVAMLLRLSLLGRYALAIGSNEATARLCGVRVERMKVLIYVVAGLLTGLAGLLQFARLTQGDPTVAIGLELDVIAAVVIGGGSLAGGQGSLLGTLAGAFMMAYLRNRCTREGWPNFVQDMIVGHIIILAVALDLWRSRARQA